MKPIAALKERIGTLNLVSCSIDPESKGLNGTHPEEFGAYCAPRKRCNEECCVPPSSFDEASFDEETTFCIVFREVGLPKIDSGDFSTYEPTLAQSFRSTALSSVESVTPTPTAEKKKVTVGMYARGGKDEGAFRNWADKFAGGAGTGVGFATGTDILTNLQDATEDPGCQISKLSIFSHAWAEHYNNDKTALLPPTMCWMS